MIDIPHTSQNKNAFVSPPEGRGNKYYQIKEELIVPANISGETPGLMTHLEELERLYGEYLVQARQSNRDPLNGAFGFFKKSGDDPCHSRFARELEALLRSAAEEEADPGELCAMLRYIYLAPKENREPQAAYWMLMAVHALTPELAGRLRREDAEALWSEYRAAYPRWDRLPAQKKVLAALDTARKGK